MTAKGLSTGSYTGPTRPRTEGQSPNLRSTSHCSSDLHRESEALFVNASSQGTEDHPIHPFWLVDLDLLVASSVSRSFLEIFYSGSNWGIFLSVTVKLGVNEQSHILYRGVRWLSGY